MQQLSLKNLNVNVRYNNNASAQLNDYIQAFNTLHLHQVTPKYQSSWFRISSPARSSSLSLDSSNQVMILPVAVTGFSPLKIKSGIGSLGQDIFILMMSTPFSRWNHNCKLSANKWVCDAKEFDILTNTGRFSS